MADTPEIDTDAIRQEFEAALRGQAKGVVSYQMSTPSHIKHVIGVVSGKGGVGKSLVCGAIAVELKRQGYEVGILDADITGPSIPKMFGLSGRRAQADATGEHIAPVLTQSGIKIISTNLVLEDETDPVLWRGPMLGNVLQQFWGDTNWGEIDYLLVDMPPGTGDVALSVFQSLPVDGIVVVTSPQDLVQMVVAKAVKMAEMMEVSVLGLVENFSYALCPCCGKKIELFGNSHVEETARAFNLEILGRLAHDPSLAAACDAGTIEEALPQDFLDGVIEKLISTPEKA